MNGFETWIVSIGMPWVPFFILINAFLKTSLIFGTHDLVFLELVKQYPHFSFLLISFSALGSVCGAFVLYVIGRQFFRTMFIQLLPEIIYDTLEECYEKISSYIVAIAGFGAFFMKPIFIVTGIFEIKLSRVLLIVFFSQLARYSCLGWLVSFKGGYVASNLLEYMRACSIFIAFIVCFICFISVIVKMKINYRPED